MKRILEDNNPKDDFHYLCLAEDITPGKSRSFSITDNKGTKKSRLLYLTYMKSTMGISNMSA
jgi:hypothetical protein